jgi:hypothetical protein
LCTPRASAGASAAASGGAVVTRQTFRVPFSDTGLTDGCNPGATGSIVGTANFSFQDVRTATGFLVVSAVEVDTGRIDWINGWYTIIASTDRFGFEIAAQGTTVVNTDAHVDFGDSYSADGVFLFRETFHAAEHFTVTNGTVTRVQFDTGHFHVFGSDCTP